MEVVLNSPKKIVTQPEKSFNVEKLTITRVVDLPKQKIVRCFCEELDEAITLWEGSDYESIGQWTDVDVANRLTELYS